MNQLGVISRTLEPEEEHRNRIKLLSHLIEGQKVLEIGCGNGDLSVEIARLGFDVVGIDISKLGIQQAVELAKKENLDTKAQFKLMDATSLEFADNSFDTVLIAEVLEHIRDSRRLIEEAIRVTRNGGRIIICVPDGLLVPFQGHLRVFLKDTLTTELNQHTPEVRWHELPFKKWLVCSFFVRKRELNITEGPAVVILMPTYNGRKYIRNAIKSVLDQTYQNWTLAVVNDGGEDVNEILDEFHDDRIKYIVTEHKGKAHALNVGITNSNGELIGYLDDDDILYPIHLEVLIKAASGRKKEFVYSDWYEVSLDEDDREIGREFEFRQDVTPWMLFRLNYINHKCILHARSLLEKTGIYDEELEVLIDWDMIRRLAFISKPYHVLGVTSERLRYYNKAVLENRITGLWTRSPDKARRSMERIANKTMYLPATTEELKKAVIDTMLHRSYYHSLELNNSLQAKDTQISHLENMVREREAGAEGLRAGLTEKERELGNLKGMIAERDSNLSGLTSALSKSEAHISHLERVVTEKVAILNHIYNSYGWKVLLICYRLMEKIFPVDTKRRSFAKIIFRMVINPRYFLKNPNKRNLEKFGHYFRTAEPAIAEEKIEKKISVASKKNEVHHIEVEFYENMTLDRIEYLNFPSYGQVLVSIIIPVRNKWQYTYRCLKSVLKNSKHVPYEIIIANDASTDETSEMLKRITGIETINNQANQGFLKNCNNAVRYAKGKYILFLNNDTEVKEQWLQNLVEIAERDDKVGVVGGKILFPDGRLQEAGSIMDGEGWGQPYGRFDDPDRYEYNYVKETDLITGACLLIRKDGFLKIRGFDERYAPAFYEEFDLEFAMREIGYKIIYQPKAVIVHHQSSSYESEIRDSLSTINHSKFMKKWANRIWGQNSNSGVFLSRDRSKDKKVILFFDEKVPDYDKHAGSLSTYQYIKLLHEMGFKLIFIPDSLKPLEPYATELQQAGIEVVYGPFEFESWIKCNGQYIHYVWLSRPDVAIKYVEAIKCYTEAKILYYTVDLHYLRALRRYQIEKGKEILDESMRLKKIEFYLFENVDVILTPSDQEQKIIREGFPQKRIVTIPVIYYEANSIVGQNLTDFDGRHGIIFLGGFDHLPNVDAVKWFISDIFPVIKGKLPQIKLYIAGSNPPPEIAALNNNDIIVMGYVKDLEQIFKTKRVFVSPLRYGAGVKGKIITSMSYGVPVVTTCVGNEGINLRNGIEAFVVDDAVEFADRTVELYTNAELRSNFSRNSLLFVKNNFSKVKAKNMMLDVCGIIREKCSVCGALINFSPADTVENLRETTVCHFCSSLSRTIDLAECILKVNDIPLTSSLLQSLEKFKDLHIYELAHMGPIYEIFSRSPHFTWSEYFEEVTPGTFGPSGVRCEDVQQLTFKDNTFDLIISQDVFEHVPDPKRGFREIFRVLKPGGYHVFTVPFDRNTPKSVTRAIIGTTKELKHILDPIHHGDPIRSEGALVFSDFGRDLIDTLNSTGFEVEICERHYPRYRGGYNAVFLTKKRA